MNSQRGASRWELWEVVLATITKMREVTRILSAIEQGNLAAAGQLLMGNIASHAVRRGRNSTGLL